ncbi:MAG: TetR/AcrR family transcriptional regulator [Stomatobaculum sp.]
MTQTEQLLTAAFWQLLEEKPYKKITVRDIVDRCQVNRNTFYYHFEGIPSLLERAILEWEKAILSDPRIVGAPLLGILPIAESCLTHRAALLNLFRSAARDDVLRFIEDICRHVAESYMAAAAAELRAESATAERAPAAPAAPHRHDREGSENRLSQLPALTEEDHLIMVRFYKALLSGCLLTWLNEGMNTDLPAEIHRVLQILSIHSEH